MRDGGFSFGAGWPTADSRIRPLLHSRGHCQADIEDILQATAEKAIRHGAFNDETHLIAWSLVVAKNHSTDLFRRNNRELLGSLPELQSTLDVADTVAALLARDRLVARIAALPEQHQAALFSVETPSNRKEAIRIAVVRHRIRQRLRHVVEGLAVAFGRFATRVGSWCQRAADSGVAVAGAVALATGLVVLGQAVPSSQPHSGRRESRTGSHATLARPNALAALVGVGSERSRPSGRPSRAITVTLAHDSNGNAEGFRVGDATPEQTRLACVAPTLVTPQLCTPLPAHAVTNLLP
jgi:sigma-70-like protein